jgi:hypothetical protein
MGGRVADLEKEVGDMKSNYSFFQKENQRLQKDLFKEQEELKYC